MFIYVFIILIYNFIYFALAYYKIAVRFQNVSLKIRFAHDTHVLGNGVGVGYCVGCLIARSSSEQYDI
jgi:membrane associated rhomboid family serine protease